MTYVPVPGDRVRVRRWVQPTLTRGDPARELTIEVTGAVERVHGGVVFLDAATLAVLADNRKDADGALPQELAAASLGYTFLGGDPRDGSCRYFVTEVTPEAEPTA